MFLKPGWMLRSSISLKFMLMCFGQATVWKSLPAPVTLPHGRVRGHFPFTAAPYFIYRSLSVCMTGALRHKGGRWSLKSERRAMEREKNIRNFVMFYYLRVYYLSRLTVHSSCVFKTGTNYHASLFLLTPFSLIVCVWDAIVRSREALSCRL